MSSNTVKLIVEIVRGTLRKGHSVPLHELLWTVDAQLHLIVSAEELNEALLCLPPVRIKRTSGRVELVSSRARAKLGITAADIDGAAAIYSNHVSGLITKLGAKRSK